MPSATNTAAALISRPPGSAGACGRWAASCHGRLPVRVMPHLGAAEFVKSAAASRLDSFSKACVLQQDACKITSASQMHSCPTPEPSACTLAASFRRWVHLPTVDVDREDAWQGLRAKGRPIGGGMAGQHCVRLRGLAALVLLQQHHQLLNAAMYTIDTCSDQRCAGSVRLS
jgi:hypothetical protein